MSVTQTQLFPPPNQSRATDERGYLTKTQQLWQFTLQNLLPLRQGDTSSGPFAEALPPAGLNSTTGQSNQNQEIIYLKISADANGWTITGAASGDVTLTNQYAVARFKSDGTSWWAVCCGSSSGSGPALQVNGTPNADQSLLNLVDSFSIVFSDDGAGAVEAELLKYSGAASFTGAGTAIVVVMSPGYASASDYIVEVSYEYPTVAPGRLSVEYVDGQNFKIHSDSATDASAVRYIAVVN